jgi:hypothetical protein
MGVGEQCSQESAEARGESDGFYGSLWDATGEMGEYWGDVGRAKRSKVEEEEG